LLLIIAFASIDPKNLFIQIPQQVERLNTGDVTGHGRRWNTGRYAGYECNDGDRHAQGRPRQDGRILK
jgi:hypothetical protein